MPKALWPVILCLRDVQSGRTHRDGTRVAGDGGTGARVWGLLWGKETFWNETEAAGAQLRDMLDITGLFSAGRPAFYVIGVPPRYNFKSEELGAEGRGSRRTTRPASQLASDSRLPPEPAFWKPVKVTGRRGHFGPCPSAPPCSLPWAGEAEISTEKGPLSTRKMTLGPSCCLQTDLVKKKRNVFFPEKPKS